MATSYYIDATDSLVALRYCKGKGTNLLELRFTREERGRFEYETFYGDNGEVHVGLTELLNQATSWCFDTEEAQVERALSLAETVAKIAARGDEWARAVGWKG